METGATVGHRQKQTALALNLSTSTTQNNSHTPARPSNRAAGYC